MKSHSFIGNKVSFEKMKAFNPSVYDPEEFDDKYSVAEIFLEDFELFGPTDSSGRNAYSIQIYLDQDKIIRLQRVGHCHMCGGQGSDEYLNRFPHKELEIEAEDVLESLLNQK